MTEEIKIYRVAGHYTKKYQRFTFKNFVRALNEAQAKEQVLSKITSTKVYRRKVILDEITPIKLEECDDLYIKALCELK